MKKLAYVLGFLFVAGMAVSTYAISTTNQNSEKVCTVNQSDDEKPCPANCTCAKCEKAKADKAAKAEGKTAKADCSKEVKCDKEASKSCCGSKSAPKTESKKETPAEKK